MLFIEDKDFLSNDEKQYIEENFISNQFPLYQLFGDVNDDGKSNTMLQHHIVERNTDNFNSVYYPFVHHLVSKFTQKHNLPYTKILRSAVNLTFKDKLSKCSPHTDHIQPHNQLIIYINEPLDKFANTVILSEDEKTIEYSIQPEKYKAICFESRPHFLYYPDFGTRMIIITTFI